MRLAFLASLGTGNRRLDWCVGVQPAARYLNIYSTVFTAMAMAVVSGSSVSPAGASLYHNGQQQAAIGGFRPVLHASPGGGGATAVKKGWSRNERRRRLRSFARLQVQVRASVAAQASGVDVDVDGWNKKIKAARLDFLESQALDALRTCLATFESPTFPCALITGDVVILDLLSKLGAYKDDKVKVVFVDTLHLFDETYEFLKTVEEKYGFKANVFRAAGIADKQEYVDKYGSDLFLVDVDKYDKICKVEPFNRALSTLKTDAMINGRRRDHGAERAHLEIFDGGKSAKVQPLAYWEFRDCWDYIEKYHLPYHPLHDEGYPSIGDIQSTLPVPRDQWFEYGGERSGRFQGLTNKDGSLKTECGIHSPASRS